MPFILDFLENTEQDKVKIQKIHKLNTTHLKQITQNIVKQNYPGLVAFYDTWPGNEVGLLYKAPEPTRGYRPNLWSNTLVLLS